MELAASAPKGASDFGRAYGIAKAIPRYNETGVFPQAETRLAASPAHKGDRQAPSLTESEDAEAQAARAVRSPVMAGCSPRNFFTAAIPATMNSTITTTCVTANGGSDCVGASALRAGNFSKS